MRRVLNDNGGQLSTITYKWAKPGVARVPSRPQYFGLGQITSIHRACQMVRMAKRLCSRHVEPIKLGELAVNIIIEVDGKPVSTKGASSCAKSGKHR